MSETIHIAVTETPETVIIDVVEAVATVKNSDNTYTLVAPARRVSVLPDITHTDTNGDPVVLPAQTPMVCTPPVLVGVDIKNSDETYEVHADDGDVVTVPDTTIKNTAGTTILVQPSATNTGVISDCRVVNSDLTYDELVPAETTHNLADVPNVDSDGSTVMTPAMTPFVATPAATPEGWNPPADWGWDEASALISDGANGFVGVFAVYPDINNYVTIKCGLTGMSAGTIYWGDGTTTALVSGTQHNKILLYDDISASPTTYGYKVAIIRVSTTSTSLNSVELSLKHPNEKTINTTNWLALKIRSQYTGVFTYTHRTDKRARMLEVLDFGTTLTVSPFLLCDNHQRLQQLVVKFAAQAGNQLFASAGCQFLDLADIDFSPIAGAGTSLFNGCMYAGAVEKSIPAITTLSNAFAYSNVNKIILTDTSLVTDIGAAIYDSDVEVFEMEDASAVTAASTFVSPYTNMRNRLKRLILPGMRIGLNLSYQQISAEQINALGDSLGTANGSQTFTFTGNEGAATADSTKFTNKGYTYTY